MPKARQTNKPKKKPSKIPNDISQQSNKIRMDRAIRLEIAIQKIGELPPRRQLSGLRSAGVLIKQAE